MDKIEKVLLFDKQVSVSVIKITDIVNKLKNIHEMSETATTALGRTLTMCAFMSSNLKGADEKLSISINGGGPIGNIIVAGKSGCRIRGYVSHPEIEPPKKENGNLDVGFAVGKEGDITVIKDLGLKEPYIGKSPLVTGEIGDDFAYYYTKSEQQPSGIAVGVTIEDGKVVGAGGVIIQPLPNCPDHIITILEDIISKFTNISTQLKDKEPIDIINEEFAHFDHEMMPAVLPKYECICSQERMDGIIKSLSPVECFEALKTDRKMEIVCHFCNTKYNYTAEEVIELRNQKKETE